MILYLDKRGLDFCKDEPAKSDLNNYLVTTNGYTVKGRDGRKYFLEFSLWRAKRRWRTTTLNGKRLLLHPVVEIKAENIILLRTQYETKKGTFGNSDIDGKIADMEIPYTQAGILQAVNTFSKCHYTKIKFID